MQTQYLYSYIHFAAAILYLILGILIIVKDPRSHLNQACSGVVFCFFIWSFATVWVHHPATSVGKARMFSNIASFGWIFFNTFHLWFAWLYTKRSAFRFIKGVTVLLAVLPVVLFYQQWRHSVFLSGYVSRSYGWFTPWASTSWTAFYFIYLTGMALTGFGLIFNYGRKSDNVFLKKQSTILIVTGTCSLGFGFLFNIILSVFVPDGVPPIGDVTSLLWAAGLSYVAIRYNILNITPFIAAERIIGTMKDLLFLLDTHGYIISVSTSALQTLHCGTHRITARHFGEIIIDTNNRRNMIMDSIMQESVYTAETVVSCLPGPIIPVTLSTSLIPGTGVVCVAHDNSLQKQRTESLKEAKKQLETRVLQATEELRMTNDRLKLEVTERKLAAAALKDSEERFRIIFEWAPDGIYLIDRTGDFLDGNKEVLRITGYTKEELTGTHLFYRKLLSEEGLQNVTKLLLHEGISTSAGYREIMLYRKDGSTIPVEVSAHPLTIGEKKLSIGIIRDLSQRKKAEQEAEDLKQELHHSQKMDAIGQLAGGVAHDFNNLLGGIIGYSGLIKKRLSDLHLSEAAIMQKIIDVAKQASDRTAQLLAFARKGKYRVETLAMHDLIVDVIGLMKHTVDPRIMLVQQLDAENATVEGDRSQLHSALLNLGVNAKDVLPEGGTIVFSTENIFSNELPLSEALQLTGASTYLKIVVRDNGPGMDEATKARVFEPFFSTKEEGKGTGLGLPSVYGTVKQHNGFISLITVPGAGSAFELFLPVAETVSAPVAAELELTVRPVERHRGTILVVDDTPLICDMMVETLREVGYTVHSFNNGTEALPWFAKHYRICDLVILDFTMPELNGKECFSAMKKTDPEVKAIITSGHAIDGEIEKAMRAGVLAFLQKPFEIATLEDLVEEILADECL